jgi:hypothetical protein
VANGIGTATLDFGAWPGGNEASVAVTGQATISATSVVEAYIMADDSTTDHDATDHKYLDRFVSLTVGTPVAATGFTIYGRTGDDEMIGKFSVRWVWSD